MRRAASGCCNLFLTYHFSLPSKMPSRPRVPAPANTVRACRAKKQAIRHPGDSTPLPNQCLDCPLLIRDNTINQEAEALRLSKKAGGVHTQQACTFCRAAALSHCFASTYQLQGSTQREAPEANRAQVQAPVQGQRSAPDTLSAVEISAKQAAVLHQRGLGDEAEVVQRDVVARLEAILGAEHPHTVAARAILADMVYQRGGLQEAQGLQEGVLEACMRVLGADAPSTLSARVGLANTLARRGRLQEAERSLREVLRVREVALGPSHLDTVSVRASLAAALAMNGKFDEAQWLAEVVCEAREKALGADAPDVHAARDFLAYVQRQLAEQQEELAQQQQREEHVLKQLEEELGRQRQREEVAHPAREQREEEKTRRTPSHPQGGTWSEWLAAHAQPGAALGSRLLHGPALLLSAPARLLRSGIAAVPALPGGARRNWVLSAACYARMVWNSSTKHTAARFATTICAFLRLDAQDKVRLIKSNAADRG